MTSPTMVALCNAIKTTLATATGLTYAQSYSEISDGMQDQPLLQVYWEDITQDPSGTIDRTTFHKAVKQEVVTIFADLYARQRAHIGEDMGALVPLVDAIKAVLDNEKGQPFFGLAGVQGFQWVAKRVIFEYGDPAIRYMGARFTFTVRLF